jgi:cystathionine beta-lyase/cystathionine gamma-synthase
VSRPNRRTKDPAGLSSEERACRRITDSMMRLSVGLEDPADLIADPTQALNGVEQ